MQKFDVTILTLFPDMFPGPLGYSLAGKALKEKKWSLDLINLYDQASEINQRPDDSPFGGGAGMIMRPDVIGHALNKIDKEVKKPILYMTPRGKPITQQNITQWAQEEGLVILCGRYEGIDQRAEDTHAIQKVSLGDYILSGGEMAALVVIDACIRLLPNIIGNQTSLREESFSNGLLEYPHYTRPAEWKNQRVPEILLSGHHEKIRQWRLRQAEKTTRENRKDLWDLYKTKPLKKE